MKKILLPFAAACVAALSLTACNKEVTTVETPDEISAQTLAQIKSMGYGTSNVQKHEDGYLVEGDIVLTPELLSSNAATQFLRVGNEEQYRTTNLVSGPRTITVAMESKLASKPGYIAALDELVRRYNAENLTLTFARVSAGADITFVNANGSYLASAGFPTGGNPYNKVSVNSRAIGTGTTSTFINYLATIISHEAGHCIGFRHTDYMDRSYSCGGSTSNEGASTVGAILIPGTPAAADPNSWMLACIGSNGNRPFNANDKTALAYLY